MIELYPQRRLAFTLLTVATLLTAQAALAADVSQTAVPPGLSDKFDQFAEVDGLIDITGPIEPGDAEVLAALVAEMDPAKFTSGAEGAEVLVRLNSPGGSFKEAIEIARLIDKHQLQTFVEAGSDCLSACAVIFMAGTYQPGSRQQEVRLRMVEWPARLGFHRPFAHNLTLDITPDVLRQLTEQDLESIFNEEFSAAFDTANQLIQEMVGVNPSAWSPELLVRMLTATAPSGDEQFVFLETVDDALTWGIKIVNARPPAGQTAMDKYVENFWLCYNAGRAIPAYDGIWPDRPEVEEGLQWDLEKCCGRNGAHWFAKMVEDDLLTFYTRIRGWYFGCTVTYEQPDAQPLVRFFHDQSTVTRTDFLQRYNPGTPLGRVTAPVPAAASADEWKRKADILAEPGRGRCFVFAGEKTLDEDPCERSITTDATHGLVETYRWPSGAKTVVTKSLEGVTLNGAPAVSNYEVITGNRRGFNLCLRSEATLNTFCYKSGE
jgi:hypothetical protein